MKNSSSDQNPLNHFDDAGNARMVDVGSKPDSDRIAVAGGEVRMAQERGIAAAEVTVRK